MPDAAYRGRPSDGCRLYNSLNPDYIGDDALETLTGSRLNENLPSDQRATLISVSSMAFSLVMIALAPMAGGLAA